MVRAATCPKGLLPSAASDRGGESDYRWVHPRIPGPLALRGGRRCASESVVDYHCCDRNAAHETPPALSGWAAVSGGEREAGAAPTGCVSTAGTGPGATNPDRAARSQFPLPSATGAARRDQTDSR